MNKTALNKLTKGFLDTYDQENPGWGQFIDKAHHPQRGGLGTSSGAILLGLSSNGSKEMVESVCNFLVALCNEPNQQCQNVRLAWMYLGLSIIKHRLPTSEQDKVHAIRERLLRQRNESGLWGAYWISDKNQDSQTSLFSSAFSLLSLVISRDCTDDQALKDLGIKLQDRYLESPESAEGFEPLLFAAVCLSVGPKADPKLGKHMRAYAWSRVSFSRAYIYFYDFQCPNDDWGRDYIVVPIDLLVPLTLRVNTPSLTYQLRGLATISLLRKALKKQQGKYIAADGKRPSSFEQALAGLAIDSMDRGSGSLKHFSSRHRWIFKVYYFLLKDQGQLFERCTLTLIYLVYAFGITIFLIFPLEQAGRFAIAATFMAMNGLNRFTKLMRGMVGREK